MDHWTADYTQRRWNSDINSYYRWKALRDACTTEFGKEHCQKNMDRIKKDYPNHRQVFED